MLDWDAVPAGFTFDKMLHTAPDDAFDIILKIHVRVPFRLIRETTPYFCLKVLPYGYRVLRFIAEKN